MWNEFSMDSWNRWKAKEISGIEICGYKDLSSLEKVSEWCEDNEISLGIHSPVFSSKNNDLPWLTSANQQIREAAWQDAEQQIRVAACTHADYLLFHYPYPSLLAADMAIPFPALLKKGTHEYISPQKKWEWQGITHRLFDQLAEWERLYNVRIVLELDFFAYGGEFLVEMLEEYPEVQLVLDTARWDIARRAFGLQDTDELLKALAPYVYLVHYSNVRYRGLEYDNHLPDLPEYDRDSAYGNSFAYLQTLATVNDWFHVTFEHKADSISREQLDSIYGRVAQLLIGAA